MATTKTNLVKAAAATTGFSQADVGRVLDALLDAMHASMERGEDIRVYGFGNLIMKPRAARSVKLYGKERRRAPAHYYPVFEPGSKMKKAGRLLVDRLPILDKNEQP